MAQTLEQFGELTRPLIVANDNGAAHGKRVVGYRTMLTLGAIERLLLEELKGMRSLPREFKARLHSDRDELRCTSFDVWTASAALGRLNKRELTAISTLIAWASYSNNRPVTEIFQSVFDRFKTTSLARLKRNQYDEIVRFLVEPLNDNTKH